MTNRLARDDSGWRSLGNIVKDAGLSTSIVYGNKSNQLSPAVKELLQRGFVEQRFFRRERGRGGEVMRLRVAYEKDPIRDYVEQKIRRGKLGKMTMGSGGSVTPTVYNIDHKAPSVSGQHEVNARRLAAIMFIDMAGYTALGQRNESLALALLSEGRKLIRPVLEKHNGREIKTMGDGFLVEYPNALDSVRCAYDIQRKSRELNLSLPMEKRIALRIGIHVGDVVGDDLGDILGDAVNVASRIQSRAEEGGVCLTQQVFDHVRNKFELPLKSMGRQLLKNVSYPIEVYKMLMPWDEAREITITKMSEPDRRRIAVLPFTNISPDPRDEYFADGMTEELISNLSRIRELKVISRTSVMRYKGVGKSAAEIAAELNVGSILEGSVRKTSDDLRITAQLIDGRNDEYLWTQVYDKKLKNVFSIQREIAESVVDALKIELVQAERKDIEKSATANTEAYTLYLKGRYYWNERTRESNEKAVAYFNKAISLDSRYALAYAGLADCYLIAGDYDWMRPKDSFPVVKKYISKAIEIDPRLAEPHASLGVVCNEYEQRWQESEEEFKQAISLKPSYLPAHMWYGLLLTFLRRYNEAYQQFEIARDLDPLSRIVKINLVYENLYRGETKKALEQVDNLRELEPNYPDTHTCAGLAHFLDSDSDTAIDELRQAVSLSGGDITLKAELACILGFAGLQNEALKLLGELLEFANSNYVSKLKIALVLFGVGRIEEGFDYLDKAYDEGSLTTHHGISLTDFLVLPWFEEARKDPRWTILKEKLQLPEARSSGP